MPELAASKFEEGAEVRNQGQKYARTTRLPVCPFEGRRQLSRLVVGPSSAHILFWLAFVVLHFLGRGRKIRTRNRLYD